MEKFDLVQGWLDNVAYRHSRSLHTEAKYTYALNLFCKFIGKTPDQVVAEYKRSEDREFKLKYAKLARAFIGSLMRQDLTVSSINTYLSVVRSFFKYNDLPLAYIPTAKNKMTYHNRDITKEEIIHILSISDARDKAFFCMMAQSGLRPITLCHLKLKHIQPDFQRGKVPCRIEVPQEIAKGEYHSYFTFIGEESIKYLESYLKTRPGLGPNSYVFTAHGSNKPLNAASISHIFLRHIRKLKEKGVIEYEDRANKKPSELRLYNLRKWFRKRAGNAGVDFVNFWMGHSLGVDDHYFSRDPEHHRKKYAEEAMPHLRLETASPSETDRVIQKQAEEIEALKRKLAETEDVKRELADLKQLTRKLVQRVEAMEREAEE